MSTLLLRRPASDPASPGDLAAVQRRTLRALVVTQVVGGAGLSAGASVVALIAVDLSGSTASAGLPLSASVAGTAAAAIPLATWMRRRGRRSGLRAGWLVGALGAVGVVAATTAGSLLLFVVGMALLGCAGAASDASRHVAADLATGDTAGRAIGTVVAATAVSTSAAPLFTGALSSVAADVGLPPLAGPFLLSAVAFTAAGAVVTVLLRPDPLSLARQLGSPTGVGPAAGSAPSSSASTRELLVRPGVLLATAGAATVNASMVALMAMTPVHLAAHGAQADHLGAIGTVISLHIAAMFAPSPVTGRLVDRLGGRRVLAGGAALVVLAGLGALAAGPADLGLVGTSVVLLGLGWNASFVAGTSLVASAVAPADRPRVQGLVDTASGVAAVGAGGLAGVMASTVGYGGIGLVVVTAATLLGVAAVRRQPAATPRIFAVSAR